MDPQPRERFAAVFRALLDARGLSQRQAVILLGVSDSQVSRWRQGRGGIRLESIERIAEVFHQDRDELAQLAGLRDSSSATTIDAIDAERRLWRSRYDYLIEKKVPHWAREAYISACEALADAYNQMRPGEISTPANESLSKRSGTTDDGRPDADLGELADTYRPRKSTLLSARSTALATAG